MSLLLLLVAWVAGGTLLNAQPTVPADTSGYVWDGACKDCHSEIYESWARTRHKTALSHLSAEDQAKGCAACHLTGAALPLTAEGTLLNGGVQCEACHGPGREHVESATTGTKTPVRFAKTPDESLCVQCHNAKSPRFKGFFYAAMKPLVHKG